MSAANCLVIWKNWNISFCVFIIIEIYHCRVHQIHIVMEYRYFEDRFPMTDVLGFFFFYFLEQICSETIVYLNSDR